MKNIKLYILDIINFFKFRNQVKKLDKNNDIEFKKLGLKTNKIGNIVYYQFNCTEDELISSEYSPLDMVMKKIKPQIDFLCNLGWGDYILPQINNFIDNDGNNTLSYLAIFMYYPQKLQINKIIKFFAILVILTLLFFVSKWFIGMYI